MPFDLEVCDEIVRVLGDAELSMPLDPIRTETPAVDLENLGSLLVQVVPLTIESEFVDRGDSLVELYEINVGIQKIVADDFDELRKLTREVYEYLLRAHRRVFVVKEGVRARVITSANEPMYDLDDLKRRNVYTSVIELVYRISRELGD